MKAAPRRGVGHQRVHQEPLRGRTAPKQRTRAGPRLGAGDGEQLVSTGRPLRLGHRLGRPRRRAHPGAPVGRQGAALQPQGHGGREAECGPTKQRAAAVRPPAQNGQARCQCWSFPTQGRLEVGVGRRVHPRRGAQQGGDGLQRPRSQRATGPYEQQQQPGQGEGRGATKARPGSAATKQTATTGKTDGRPTNRTEIRHYSR